MAQEDQKVQDLPDIQSSSNDNYLMVITDINQNQLRKEKVADFITDTISSDDGNLIKKGSDDKLFAVDTTNAVNIVSGTLDIERLPNTGVMPEKYSYPEFVSVNNKGQITEIKSGTSGGDNANKDLSNLSEAGKNKLGGGFNLFDMKISDHVLIGEESIGWTLQGSLVTKIYPQAVEKIIELYNLGDDTTNRGIPCKVLHPDGRYIADISQKSAIDELFASTGIADFYILDSVNEQFYLPKSRWFNQFTVDTSLINTFNEAGLPNITGQVQNVAAAQDNLHFSSSGAFANTKETGSWSKAGTTNWAGKGNIEIDASLSNSIYGKAETVQPTSSNKLLYYKVGNTVVNESMIDVGQVLSQLNLLNTQKLNADHSNDSKPYILESNTNGLSGYIEFSTGLLVQWGKTPQGTVKTDLVKEYKENNYIVLTTWDGGISSAYSAISVQNRQPSSFESYSVGARYWLTIGK